MVFLDRDGMRLYIKRNEQFAFPWVSAMVYVMTLLLAPWSPRVLFALTFLVQAYRLIRYDARVCSIDMAFTAPFASFYRMQGGISYVVLYLLLFVIVFLFKRRKFYLTGSLLLLCMTAVWIILRLDGQFESLLFMVSGLVYLYLLYFEFHNSDHRSVLWAFVLGVLISTLYGFFFQDNEVIMNLIHRDAEINDGRFRGLFSDPNYLSTFLILAMVSLMCMDLQKRINRLVFFACMAVFAFLGVLTVSKSFALMLVVIIIYYGIDMLHQNRFFAGVLLLVAVVILLDLTVAGRIEWLQEILARFQGIDDLSEFTTGRTDSWLNYLKAIFSDMWLLLFGVGLDAPLIKGVGTHNILLEIVYYMGATGLLLLTAFFGVILVRIHRDNYTGGKKSLVRLLPILAIFMMYFALQGITSTLFYLSLFVMYEGYACVLQKTT